MTSAEPHAQGWFLFDQDRWWVDREQRRHLLDELSDAYLSNIIGHLERHAEHYYFTALRRSLHEMIEAVAAGHIPGEVVADALGATPLTALTPRAWLEGTPLMRALRHRARNSGRNPLHREG